MKKNWFAFSCISILIGIITIIGTSILNQVMPKMGRIAFQAAMKGSYSPSQYKMDFSFANNLSIIMIIIGVFGVFFSIYFLKDKH